MGLAVPHTLIPALQGEGPIKKLNYRFYPLLGYGRARAVCELW